MLTAPYVALHEPGRFQHADVARYTGECHRQWSCQIRNAGITFPQPHQQQAASGVGERGVRPVQHLIFNHIVDYSGFNVVFWN